MTAPPHLQQALAVGVVVLVVGPLVLHLVPLAGADQLVPVVEQRRVQGVAVDQAHEVLPVVLTAPHTQRHRTS